MSWSVLPWDLTSFVGRQEERQALLDMATAVSSGPCVVSIHGMAGVGKTRLARVASEDLLAHFPGGRLYCELGDKPDATSEVLARLLGEEARPEDLIEQTAMALTRRERSLIVLDHAGSREEELRAALPSWLSAGAHMFIVTAQAPLALRGVRRMSLGPLSAEASYALLADRVAELGTPMPPSRPDTDSLLTTVGGSPLAIELIAGALALRSPREVEDALTSGKAVLQSEATDVPRRHQSLDLALQATWDDLPAPDRGALIVACAFEARFHADDFTKVAERFAAAGETLSLSPLVARGLIARGEEGLETLAILRRFVRALLDPQARERIADAHAELVSTLAMAGDVRGDDLVRAGTEMFLVASTPPRAEQAIALLLTASDALEHRGPVRLRVEMLDRARQLATRFSLREAQAQVALEEARVARARGDAVAARSLLTTIDSEAGSVARFRFFSTEALVSLDLGQGDEARHALACALDAAASDEERAHVLATSFAMDLIGCEAVDETAGLEAWELFASTDCVRQANKVMVNLALSSLHKGDHSAARARIRSALEAAERDGDRVVQAGCLLFRGLAELDLGLDAEAVKTLACAEALAFDLGRRSLWSDAVGYGAIARLFAGDRDGLAQLASHVGDLKVFGMSGSGALFAAVLDEMQTRGKAALPLSQERPLIGRAIAILRGAEVTGEVYGVQARMALRLRKQVHAPARSGGSREEIRLARDGSGFARGDRDIDLRRRGPLRNILCALVQQHLAGTGALSPEQLVAAGWPDEVIQPEAARTRLYNAIGSLRSLGLRGVIVTSASGYALDTNFDIALSDAR